MRKERPRLLLNSFQFIFKLGVFTDIRGNAKHTIESFHVRERDIYHKRSPQRFYNKHFVWSRGCTVALASISAAL